MVDAVEAKKIKHDLVQQQHREILAKRQLVAIAVVAAAVVVAVAERIAFQGLLVHQEHSRMAIQIHNYY